ncbi:hypothetical protein B0T16DRAFT_397193 [Cercophora newfieldiana]|uniref:RING-type domain-containing protein n=1 Tax=Cercophora newfieldiana TaxID=92897 RepID=A0AA40CXU5_9PEZI|nr:hypothetical protein B0T16DRAFT_397193 [Cercophora newfieldiana]
MRTPRIAILVLFFAASLFLFCRFISTTLHGTGPAVPPPLAATAAQKSSSFRTFFSFTAPFSLFPPSAAISLTDDNSTFFAARPAAFGPPLPSGGLSGRLWIGGGFTDDSLQEGEGEGELGCSDVAGWEGGRSELAMKATAEQGSAGDKSTGATVKSKNPKRAGRERSRRPADRKATSNKRQPGKGAGSVDDGTDDYLHQGLQQTKNALSEPTTNLGSSHADIQSIQETAEITGKIVLLSRGGCGFLEKVKWAQRRGAVALIVGDNQKGGPLIQMFARGNVDNVTIPSVFTSRTTAHLLSSLMQPGSYIEDILDENGNPVLKVQQSGKGRKGKKTKDTTGSIPPSAPKTTTPKPKSAAKIPSIQELDALPAAAAAAAADRPAPARRSWFSRLLWWWGSDSNAASDRSRPPSSGRLDWVIVDEWSDEKDKVIKNSLDKASKNGGGDNSAAAGGGSNTPPVDGFQIGVQDWRDPDLVGSSSPGTDASPSAHKSSGKADGNTAADGSGPKGGSITPGSGEYSSSEAITDAKSDGPSASQGGGGLMSKIFGDDDGADFTSNDAPPAPSAAPTPIHPPGDGDSGGDGEGLWVTISPTSGASPFFDTLLMLVASPLITLTGVYALLMLRAKLRRRRWRAPKSVVERLPVRTYHTVAPTPSPSQSPRNPSPTSSSPTTPLLQGRPRSRTTTGVPEPSDLLRVDNALQAPKPNPHEKTTTPHASEWKKYMGRQVECVVCLEEYVDGVSRVMSLPCGHEFHVECITPWLTTRRRTCPICKGDVVRSLARGSPSSPRYEPYYDDSDEDAEASGSGRNRSSAQGNRDVERGGIFATAPSREQSEEHVDWFAIWAQTRETRRRDSERN